VKAQNLGLIPWVCSLHFCKLFPAFGNNGLSVFLNILKGEGWKNCKPTLKPIPNKTQTYE